MSSSGAFEWGTPQVETVNFHGEPIEVVPGKTDDATMVVMKPICEHLGLDPKDQRERIQTDPLYAGRWGYLTLPSAGGPQRTFCLSLSMFGAWLFSIHSTSVKTAISGKLVSYQRECARVLYEHFFGADGGRTTVRDLLPPSLPLIAEPPQDFLDDIAELERFIRPADPVKSVDDEITELMRGRPARPDRPLIEKLPGDPAGLDDDDLDAFLRVEAWLANGGWRLDHLGDEPGGSLAITMRPRRPRAPSDRCICGPEPRRPAPKHRTPSPCPVHQPPIPGLEP